MEISGDRFRRECILVIVIFGFFRKGIEGNVLVRYNFFFVGLM